MSLSSFNLYADTGCTDPEACNYNYTNTDDDGSCCYNNCISLMMNSSYSTWDGATYEIYDATSDVLVASGDLDNAQTEGCGQSGIDVFCLQDGCYYINVGGGSSDSSISWIFNSGVNGIIEGGAPSTNTYFSIGFDHCFGCQDAIACNYNSIAILHDCTLCDFNSCGGCTYPESPEYDPSAMFDDGSCTFIFTDVCPTDIVEDGIINISDLLAFLAVFGYVCP